MSTLDERVDALEERIADQEERMQAIEDNLGAPSQFPKRAATGVYEPLEWLVAVKRNELAEKDRLAKEEATRTSIATSRSGVVKVAYYGLGILALAGGWLLHLIEKLKGVHP